MAERVSKCAKGALTPYTRLQRDALSVFESYNVAFTFLFLWLFILNLDTKSPSSKRISVPVMKENKEFLIEFNGLHPKKDTILDQDHLVSSRESRK